MRNILKAVGVLILIGVLIGFFVSDNSRYSVPDTQPNIAPTEIRSQTTTEAQPAPTGQDPFKKFLDEKSNNPNSSINPINSQSIPKHAGKDPFKEYLDKQKQNSKDQVVSPFGKN
jgi:hypothetical protein